jgi:hypothetical protein
MAATAVLPRSELWRRYGKPPQVNGGVALRALGLRGTIHPDDVCAFLYPSQEACDAYATGNREHHGHPDLGSYAAGDKVVGVVDLRRALPRPGDPALPDGVQERYRPSVTRED